MRQRLLQLQLPDESYIARSCSAAGNVAPGRCSPCATMHNGVQVDSVLINQAKFGEALRQGRPSNFDLRVAPVAASGQKWT